MADGSPFSLKERWLIVWETELPPKNFSPFVRKSIKTVLSVIVVVRCATTYAYVVSAMLVIFCLLRNTSPKLMLLWLLIAGVKSVFLTFLEALTGVYVCSAFGKIRKACIEFFISKALEIIFATYLWASVLTIYQDMETEAESKKKTETKEHLILQKMDFGRLRARSMVDESTLYKTACLNNFEFKDVPQIILQMLRKGDEMSQDSLLGPGMMLASVSNLGSLDSLKTSQSLGELGFTDLGNTEVIGLDEDENLSYKEKALKFLKITKSEVVRIRKNKTSVENNIYTIDTDIWARVKASGTHINKPKQARTQIFIHDYPELEAIEWGPKNRIRRKPFRFGFSFSSNMNDRRVPDDEESEEQLFFSQDEDDEDDDEDEAEDEAEGDELFFMSNLKEGVTINPNKLGFVQKKMKANAYEELYRQKFMLTIGPEVFDRDCKLPKVTSSPKLSWKMGTKTVSLPAMSDLMSEDSKMSKEISSEHLQQPNAVVDLDVSNDTNSSESSREMKTSLETDSSEEEVLECSPLDTSGPKEKPKKSEIREDSETQDNCSETTNLSFNLANSGKCYRKRRILIRRIGRRKNFFNSSTNQQENSDDFNPPCYPEPDPAPEKEDDVPKESKKPHSRYEKSNSEEKEKEGSGQKPFEKNIKQIYFFKKLLQKPLLDVLLTYYELKMKVYVQGKPTDFYENAKMDYINSLLQNHNQRQYRRIFQSLDFPQNDSKVWKSRVLKTADVHGRENSAGNIKTIVNIVKTASILRRLQKYERARLTRTYKSSFLSSNENFLSAGNETSLDWANPDVSSVETDLREATSSSKVESETSSNEEAETKMEDACSREEKNRSDFENPHEIEQQNGDKSEVIENAKDYTILETDPEGESTSSQESDEPISLYYSKAANLASPLFDMKRFIYPDHIHYSYKHVKKKGFDVDINRGFPLLVRESLTMGTPAKMKQTQSQNETKANKLVSKKPEFEITRRPMDLSFASTNAFAEWQNNDQNDVDLEVAEKRVQKFNNSNKKELNASFVDLSNERKTKKTKRSKKSEFRSPTKIDLNKAKHKQPDPNFNNIKYLYSSKDYALIEKLLKMHIQFNSKEFEKMRKERKPIQISSTQLHSNIGRISSVYNPAIFLQTNKSRIEKKKVDSQEERTKDMFARLESEALLQGKNMQKPFGPNRNT